MRRLSLLVGLLCILGLAGALFAQNVSNFMEQGGARWVIGGDLDIASGGEIDVESGGAFKIAGTDRTTALSTAPAAVASGYKIARGEATLDGTNPTSVTSGLATVVSCAVADKRATTPGDDPVTLTVDYGGGVTAGTFDIYAWKHNGTDPTLVASTDNDDVIAWVCVGT